jgi:phosphomethylpyrimidine synthase
VKQGCIAYKIAAHAADVALGIPGSRDRDDELTKARAALNWQRHFDLSFDPELARAYHDEDLEVDTDFCAMCGHDWCSVRISKEIVDFYSGKDELAQPEKKSQSSPGVSESGAQVLQKRGNLSSEEIHLLAHKGKKHDCHSDNVKDAEIAKVVQVNTLKAHKVLVNESSL